MSVYCLNFLYSTLQGIFVLSVQFGAVQSIMDRVLDFCTYENFSPDCEEYYIVNFPFIENEYYYDILLSFGDKCECLEPLYIRAEMKRRIQKIATLYEN